jgi:glycosyltransferase involved in cell wall biosynthesis
LTFDANKIFVIVPCYNESCIISTTITALLAQGYKVIVVDDGSSNNCREHFNKLPVYYLHHVINLGQGAAIQTGIDYALQKGADYLVTFDADAQHDVKDIEKMLHKLQEEKLEFIFGSRFLKGAATNVDRTRRLLLHISRFTNFFISGVLLSDSNNGLRLFTAAAAKQIRIKENRRTHSSDFIYQIVKKKIKFGEAPVSVEYSAYSRQKGIKNVDGINIFINMLIYKFFR